MQTSKQRNGSSEGPHKSSPATPRSTRVAKAGGSDSSATTKSTPTRTPTDRSPKVIERRSPRSPVTEKKRLSRLTELETQLTQLHDDLKKTKDQLNESESCRQRAQQEAEDAKNQLSNMTAKLEESQRQLVEFSSAEEARLQELRQISQERDRAWQSELEAIQKQHSMDSAALVTAMNEIHRLKQHLDMVVESEAVQAEQSGITHSELQTVKEDMAETLSIIEDLKSQLRNSEEAEAKAQAMVRDTQLQLELAKATVEALNAEGLKLMESINSKESELEESKARVKSLEDNVKILKASSDAADSEGVSEKNPSEKISHGFLDSEVEKLKSTLEAVELKYQEEQTQSTMKIRSAHELAERVKSDSEARETELELALEGAKSEICELKAGLIDKETELQCVSEMNKELSADIRKTEVNETKSEMETNLTQTNVDIAELKANLMDKETEIQSILEENELLKAEMGKRDMEGHKSYEAAVAEAELARAAEKDALMRLNVVTEDANKSSRNATRVAEQLQAAQAVNSEMEAELRRLRVQSDQWRKAAEAAASVLTSGNNGSLVERTCSETEYQSVAGRLLNSPFSDDLDDESPKKKNGNVMRRFSGLWKKTAK